LSRKKKEENAAVVKYLLDSGADPDKANDYALHPAPGIGPPPSSSSFVSLLFIYGGGKIACIS
jgi:hypothetical protein